MKAIVTVAVALFMVAGAAQEVSAAETYVCWYETIRTPDGDRRQIMRCRIDGVIHDPGFPPGGPDNVRLVYDLGFDSVGECYFRRSGPPSGWVVRGRDGDLLNFWWRGNGGLIGDAWVPPCISEPAPGRPPITLVYEVLDAYEFVDPTPEIVPDGIGLTGARTFVYVDPPDPLYETVPSPVTGGSIHVEIKVITVSIDWGDGAESTIPESQFELFAPHPDGEVGHPWETKGQYVMGVDYDWFVQWRVNSGPWQIIDIPATEWESPYQVDEVVGRRSG